jgi:hypothetical protein
MVPLVRHDGRRGGTALRRSIPIAKIRIGKAEADTRSMIPRGFDSEGRRQIETLSFHEMPGSGSTCANLGQVFTHIHDQDIEISERFYLDL